MAVAGPTSFFEQQDLARRNSRKLIWLFGLGLLAVIISLDLVAVFVAGSIEKNPGGARAVGFPQSIQDFSRFSGLISITSGLTAAVVGLASMGRVASLSSGGSVVADALGGRLLNPLDCKDPMEKRLLNIVEEMAIASGVPVPPVYLLDQEEGINAFAAGHRPEDAVIGVNRGTLVTLNRDQLQGVIAHEFSHILNGDMRLNIRIMGLLYGLLFLGIVGRTVLRILGDISYRSTRRSSSDDNKGNPLAVVYIFAIALFILGYVGFFVGRLIQASLSRQREYLADASAVQFTRNPDGIAGALKAIGGWANHSTMQSPAAMESAHLFFGDGVKRFMLNSPFATHPPLETRIRRLDPNWDGVWPDPNSITESAMADLQKKTGKRQVGPLDLPGMPKIPGGMAIPGTMMGLAGAEVASAGAAVGGSVSSLSGQVEQSLATAGRPGADQFGYAREFLAMLPEGVHEILQDPLDACCVTLWLLEPGPADVAQFPEPYRSEYGRVATALPDDLKNFPVDLCKLMAPAMRRLSSGQLEEVLGVGHRLIMADNKVKMGEWLVRRMISNQLRRSRGPKAGQPGVRPMSSTADSVRLLLSAAAWAGISSRSAEESQALADSLIAKAKTDLAAMLPDLAVTALPKSEILADRLDAALARVVDESAQVRLAILRAAASVVQADSVVTHREFDLIRVLADSLGCPLPPALLAQTG
jgi:Zn-dependent protease with chaperone function